MELTAEQDHRLMLDRLGIASLRPGVNGMDPEAPDAANTDESKASPYASLPDVLVMNDGAAVTTAAQWWGVRRGEVVELLDREVYGRVPGGVPGVVWGVASQEAGEESGVAVVKKQLRGRVDNASYPHVEVVIEATLVTPAGAGVDGGGVPVVVALTFDWSRWRRPGADPPPTPAWRGLVLRRGWGYALLTPTSYQADSGAGLTRGIIGLTNRGRPRSPEDWGALRAWAWGVSRLVDYFEADPAVDAGRVAIEGLSRYGKAAAVAMAYEPRLSIGFIGSSGQGGVKLMRRDFGERVENVASSGEYHWMAGNYLKYAGPLTPNDLPVDAHFLTALCAPRPVFISVGSLRVEGTWVDAVGNFLGGAHASGVYELLGARGLGTMEMPPEGVGLLEGELAFRQHEGGHTTGPNWPFFADFAARYWER